MYDTQEIAVRIKQQVKACGYNMKDMLNDLNLGINLISQLAKGQIISSINLALIADYLDCSVDYLLGRTEEQTISYYANNIHDSNCVQDNGAMTVSGDVRITKEEAELLRIYQTLDVRDRMKLMTAAFDLEDEIKKNQESVNDTVTIFEAARGADIEPGTAQVSKETLRKLKDAPKVDKI